MEDEARVLLIAGRGSDGVLMHIGPPDFKEYEEFPKETSSSIRAQAFSRDGKLLSYSDGQSVKVVLTLGGSMVQNFNCQKISSLHFSPLGRFLATWQLHIGKKDNPEASFNLHIWNLETGQCDKSLHQKRQIGWEPQWSDDEVVVARNVNNEVHFYENNNFDEIVRKIYLQKIAEFKLSPGKQSYHAVCYVPGTKGQPSNIKLYKYPNFEGNSAVIASKSFFKADKVDMKWNPKGSAVLVLTSTDADKSGASYYGEQQLYLLSTNGDSSFVQLAKEGPVYSVEWSPLSAEFCVVYGYMPAKATLFSIKGEPTFDFGTSPRNLVYYNAFGNILVLAGFGNLNGHMEFWDLKQKKEIVRTQARDTTYLEWCPDGEQLLTATLSPRLRVGNGYRIWHYTGSLIHEFNCGLEKELWEVHWRPFLPGTFPERKIIYVPLPSIAPVTPEASKAVYRPPAARGLPNTFKLHDDFEAASNLKQSNQGQMSKAALKNKKKRDAKKSKKEQGPDDAPVVSTQVTAPSSEPLKSPVTSDPEVEKKTRNLLKKLDAIQKLKDLQATGKPLELNQLDKLSKEAELIEELESLQLQ